MLKRQIRERREYLYRKHKEEAEGRIRDRKEKLKVNINILKLVRKSFFRLL